MVYEIDMVVKHRLNYDFGLGQIFDIKEDTLIIYFENNGILTFNKKITPLEIIKHDNIESSRLNFFNNKKQEYLREQIHKIELGLDKLLESYKYEDAQNYYIENRIYIEKTWYENLRDRYKKQELHDILKSCNFKDAEVYYKKNCDYIDRLWYESQKIHYKKQQISEMLNVPLPIV